MTLQLANVVLLTLALSGTLTAETLERIVAKVNGEIVTLSELEQEVETALQQLGPVEDESERLRILEELRQQVLDRMVDNMLVLQVAENRGLRVPSRFFEEWKQSLKDQMKLETDEDLERQVRLQGGTMEGLRKRFEESLLLQEVRRMEVDSKVSVSEPEIEERYRANIQDYTEPAKIRLREIVVRFDESNEVEQGRKARRLLQDIRAGADFSEVARMHSESASRDAGGDLGEWDRGDLMSQLDEVAFEMSPGDVSEILRLEKAFYIVRVEEKTEEKVNPIEDVRNEVADSIFQEKMEVQMERFVKQLRERAIVEIKL